jgi:hypothetical protein
MTSAILAFSWAGAVLLGGAAPADESTLVTASNTTLVARDLTLQAEGGELVVTFSDVTGQKRSLKASDVVELTLGNSRGANRRPGPDEVEITLTTGDLICGKLGPKANVDGVLLLSDVYGNQLVKFGQIRSLLIPANSLYLPKRLPDKPGASDVVLTVTGDRAEGTILTVSLGGVVYNSKRLGEVTLPNAQATGLWFTETESPPKEPTELFATILTTDASSIRGKIQSLREGVLTFTDLYGAEHKVAANTLSGIYIKNGRVVYLSDLEPTAVSEEANFIRGAVRASSDLEYPFQKDRSARGTKLILGGNEHRKGLGVRAHSSLTYALGGAYKRFQATVGLDSAAMGLGSVVFQIWLDGKKVKEVSFKGSDAPQALDVDVSGSREMVLVATWGGSGQSDFADWGSARLIR